MTRIITAQNVKEFLEPDVKKFSREQLYTGVKSYLGDLIRGDEVETEKLRNQKSLTYKIFEVLETEILRREIKEKKKLCHCQWKQSDYLHEFGDLLVRAGLEKKHPYDTTLLN